ncbi:PaaI family thioesterase [Maritimibacter sp. DP1N21-5]|uniref:PaaI family thioesterase n=1 Tax=Maritimibacter sp. DP1N21-5 TaxID=2836867 RepID=UPI001C44EE14|nr:PaaI family thioesterase [Maritimibacter sp. DP1N21-5]MBV7410427.1 PaaI family thioesterase [Maritimibacter sp. DP1N21-5]
MNHATRPSDLPTPDEALAVSGLVYMQKMLAGEFAGPPIAKLMNYRLFSVEPGRIVFRGSPTFEVCNPMGTVHGGWYGTLLDSAMACAVMTLVPQGSSYTTLEYKVNIIRSIPLGTEIEAIGTSQHGGRSTGVANGEIRGVEDGRLYATGSTTCIVMKVA